MLSVLAPKRALWMAAPLTLALAAACEQPAAPLHPPEALATSSPPAPPQDATPQDAPPTDAPDAPDAPASGASEALDSPVAPADGQAREAEQGDSPQPHGEARALPRGALRLASWNIEWLADEPEHGKKPRSLSDYEALARYARQLDADVIAVQEIEGREALMRVFDPKEYTYHLEDRRAPQRVGVVVRRSLKVKRHKDLSDLQLGSDRMRRGVDVTVGEGAQAVRVLAVHLKSGCWGSPLDGPVHPREYPDACQTLKKQGPVLRRWIDERRAEGGAFALLGDFNRRLRPGDELWDSWQRDPKKPDLSAPTLRAKSRCWGGKYPDYIDHLILSPEANRRSPSGSFAQLVYSAQDERDHRAGLSDHCPISVVVRAR